LESIEERFLDRAIITLRDTYLPKIKEAVALLSDQDIWWREGETSNSIGNLLMHLSGNVRQHIISGFGGKTDERNRPLEFAARGGIAKDILLTELEATVTEACEVLQKFAPSRLLETRVIQNTKVVLLDDLLHVVEHFAYHAGQIIFMVKAEKTHAFPWYKHLDPN
jgi:uncharacterized damage-inducible protein DinB